MSRVVVLHRQCGCDTGCCGHCVYLDDEEVTNSFNFSHPYGGDKMQYARNLIESILGAEHVKDLDWENCKVYDD